MAREKALKRFRDGRIDVLVATDVAARGIDVEGVTHVINYECPDDDKTYVHRIGRTGRAGASGIAITFVDWADQTRWKVINNTLGLPFEEPQETYSTSAHLYHDLGIDPAARGRIVPPKPPEPRAEGSGSSRTRRSEDRPREKRPGADPERRRLRNGVPLDGDAGAAAVSPPRRRRPAARPRPAPTARQQTAGDAPRKRNRRRRQPILGRAGRDAERERLAGQAHRLGDHDQVAAVAAPVPPEGAGAGDQHQPVVTGLLEGLAVGGQRLLGHGLHRGDPVAEPV